MHFFSTVQYSPNLIDDSWSSYAEAAADVCRAPGRWVAAELWDGGKKYYLIKDKDNDYSYSVSTNPKDDCLKRNIRVIIGVVVCLFGNLLALPLMAFAYTNEEIRLKHKLATQNLMKISLKPKEAEQFQKLVEERQRLAKERQGCEPVSCLLLSICCLLCVLVCRQSK